MRKTAALFLLTTTAGMATYILMPGFIGLLRKSGAVCKNYQGAMVASSGGFLLLWIGSLIALFSPTPIVLRLIVTAAGLGFAMLGQLDDFLGSRRDSGLIGHFRAFKQGRWTTGSLKAMLGGVFGFGLSFCFSHRLPLWYIHLGTLIVNGLLIAGGANLINLLDVRPGRAGKGFLIGSLTVLFWGSGDSLKILLPFIGALVGYLYYDLNGQVMMGDTGSNGLGAVLGLAMASGFTLPGRLCVLGGIAAVHVVAEKSSLSHIIAKFAPLKAIDRWGRPDP